VPAEIAAPDAKQDKINAITRNSVFMLALFINLYPQQFERRATSGMTHLPSGPP